MMAFLILLSVLLPIVLALVWRFRRLEGKSLRRAAVYTAAAGACLAALSALLWLLAPQFAAFFIKNAPQETLNYAISATRCYALGMPLYTLHHIFSEYSDGRGKTRVSLALKFCSEGGIIVLSAIMLLPLIGVEAIWIAFPVSQVLLTLLDALIIAVQNKKLRRKPTNFWQWYMALPTGFDVPKEDRIDRTITSREQVVELYRTVRSFCEERGCDARRTYLISLAVEELATNTLQTGFRPGKHNTIDMRILKQGDDYILRMRDDCEIFDPVKQLTLYDKNVPLHHMGIRMAIASARDVQYTTILKLNNLVLRV